MNVQQAMAAISDLLPDRDICLVGQLWQWNSRRDIKRRASVELHASILPGLDGTKCSQHKGDTLSDIVDSINRIVNPDVPDAVKVIEQSNTDGECEPGGISQIAD